MEDLLLMCAIDGVAGTFEVKIDSKERVSTLKEAFKEKNEDINGPARNLQLFLAKTADGKWLPDDDDLDKMLQNKDDISKMKKFDSSWKLNKPDLFGPDVSLGEDVVHVLVVVAKSAGDDVAPPTAMYRRPERLERWAAINEMVRQKNRDGNEKTSNQDINRKRKNRDIDRSVPYSSLSLADFEPILAIEDFDLQATTVPDEVVEQLHARLAQMQICKLYAVIEAVCLLLGDATILVEEDVIEKNVHVHGRFEFVLKRGRKRISIVEAKRDDIPQGIAQRSRSFV